MSASPSPCSQSVVVTRLRAAGCVFAEDEGRLLVSAARTPADLDAMVDQRVAGAPLEHVIGWAEFCGLRITVDPGVFVPRRRTEFLVRQAVDLARPAASPAGPAPASDQRQVVVVAWCGGGGAGGPARPAPLGQIELPPPAAAPAGGACPRRNVAAAGAQVYEGD